MSLSKYRWQHCLHGLQLIIHTDYSSSVSPMRIYSELILEWNQLRLDQWKNQISQTCSKSTYSDVPKCSTLCPLEVKIMPFNASSLQNPKFTMALTGRTSWIRQFLEISTEKCPSIQNFSQIRTSLATVVPCLPHYVSRISSRMSAFNPLAVSKWKIWSKNTYASWLSFSYTACSSKTWC